MTEPRPVDDRPQSRPRWLIPAITVVLLVAFAGWSVVRDGDTPAPVSRDGGLIQQFPVGKRASVAPIAGRLIDGGYIDSADLAGYVVVYNVWGSWCAPCRKEAPGLKRLSDESRSTGVRFVGLDVKDNDASAVAFEREHGISYPSIGTADSGQALLELGKAVPLGAVPTTVVVDRRGRVAARIVGAASYYTLKGLVDDVLKEAS